MLRRWRFLIEEKIMGQFLMESRHLRMVYGERRGKIKEMTVLAWGLVMNDLDK